MCGSGEGVYNPFMNAKITPGCLCSNGGCTSWTPEARTGKFTVKWFSTENNCLDTPVIVIPRVVPDAPCTQATGPCDAASGSNELCTFGVTMTSVKPSTLINCPWSSNGALLGATASHPVCA